MDRWENAAQERLSIGLNFHPVGGMRFDENFEVNFLGGLRKRQQCNWDQTAERFLYGTQIHCVGGTQNC
jgi:hypothetical protein